MLDAVRNHPGKASAIASGGLSISVALMLFATKGEFEMIKTRQSELWRELQDVRLLVMQRSALTPTNTIAKVTP